MAQSLRKKRSKPLVYMLWGPGPQYPPLRGEWDLSEQPYA